MTDQQPKSVLDQAYEGLGHVGAALEATHAAQQQALRDLEKREQELLDALDKADPGSREHQQLTDELDELARAWRVATDDVAEPPA